MNLARTLFTAFAATAFGALPIFAEPLDAVGKDAEKIEVTRSMIGPRDTLIFYVFEDSKAILVVKIGNKNTSFPVSGTLYAFAKTVDAEGLAKWINNQHSDGLFVDPPEPEASHEIPAEFGKAEAFKVVGEVKEHSGNFTHYSVTFGFKDVPAFGVLKLKDFTDKASVLLKGKAL